MFARGDFSERACARYHERWMAAFGRDFSASAIGARLVYRYPFLMDAANVVAQRKGDGFMTDFGAAMTGVKPKTTFVRPGLAGPLVWELLRQILVQKLLGRRRSTAEAYRLGAEVDAERESSFRNACLREPVVRPSVVKP